MFKKYLNKRFSKYLVESKNLHDGFQTIYRFPNNYGASVVCHGGSYGGHDGLFEMAVIYFNGLSDYDWTINYSNPITTDVMGFLSSKEVSAKLYLVKSLSDRIV